MDIDKALLWFNNKRPKELVTITYDGGDTTTSALDATVIEPESRVSREGIKVKSDLYIFLLNDSDLTGIDIKRGVQIRRVKNSETYQVVLGANSMDEYNDPLNNIRAVEAKKN